ncbi:NifU family protein [Actinocrinis puniceicyclus]|uniref:NifU family protein n=1 Tax=Actinocrinis puniceicyclus TaxID=977794 RepID=A0A8J8BAW0_9ACTN|nr:NifU family protein [Actinocrinis puniceicyclus]MBS2961491.1 NifU family protein [Actinocrinis puniceicyclus]
MTDVSEVGIRVEQLVGGFAQAADRARAEELVRLVVGLYGEGLERTVRTMARRDPQALAELAGDEVVGGLLLVHGLHPLSVDERVQRALDGVRPYLGSHAGGVEYLGVDDDGVARLRLAGTCNGCPSSTVTVRSAIEGAIERAAPEVLRVEVEGVVAPSAGEPRLLQIGPRPDEGARDAAVWRELPALGSPTAGPVALDLDGMRILICAVRGTLYAYRDACGVCDAPLGEAAVEQGLLTCPRCAAAFDLRLAGRCVAGPGAGPDGPQGPHLDPLPLVSDSRGVRVALPAAVSR